MELEKRQKDAAAYQDDTLAEEAKQLGNTHFRGKEWGPAVAVRSFHFLSPQVAVYRISP